MMHRRINFSAGFIAIAGLSAGAHASFDSISVVGDDGPMGDSSEALSSVSFAPESSSAEQFWLGRPWAETGENALPQSGPTIAFSTARGHGRGAGGPIGPVGHSDQGPAANGFDFGTNGEVHFLPHSDQNRPGFPDWPALPNANEPGGGPNDPREGLSYATQGIPSPGPTALLTLAGIAACGRRRRG